MSTTRVGLVELLRDPETGGPLAPAGEALAAESGRRWPVVDGVPVLRVAEPDHAGRAAIVAASRTRGATYFEDNYRRGESERVRRLQTVEQLLSAIVEPGTLVLDAGCGPVVLAETVRALGGDYVGIDLSLDNVLAGRRRAGDVDAVVGDLVELPFRSAVFDVAVALGSLEYVAELERALSELCRILRPGGMLVASFANRRSPRRRWDETIVFPLSRARAARGGRPAYRRRLHRADEVTVLVERAGAAVRELRFLNPGLLGYPLSELDRLRRAQERLAARRPALARLGSELLVVATVRGSDR